MKHTITEASFGQRPRVQLPNPDILTELGEKGMRNLVSRHYDLLSNSSIKEIFPSSQDALNMAKKHSADFFIQICGGTRYFEMSRGVPKMVARHVPFKITSKSRLVWLEMYAKALDETILDEELKKSFWTYIDIFSIWMINTLDD